MIKAIRWDAQMLDAYLRRTGQAKAAPAPDLTPSRAKPGKKAPKYRNRKVVVDGVTYDSEKEYRRWLVLLQLAAAGRITELRRQVTFELAPAARLDGEARKKPAMRYTADAVYLENGAQIVEDTKSAPTRKTTAYRMRKHLMATVHNLQIREI